MPSGLVVICDNPRLGHLRRQHISVFQPVHISTIVLGIVLIDPRPVHISTETVHGNDAISVVSIRITFDIKKTHSTSACSSGTPSRIGYRTSIAGRLDCSLPSEVSWISSFLCEASAAYSREADRNNETGPKNHHERPATAKRTTSA